ncbi:MAG: penicillin-binding protein 1B [Aeromonadaceae bacterium]|nr:penicillin-binding protein 1B [Aeromonadaceae bacterium]
MASRKPAAKSSRSRKSAPRKGGARSSAWSINWSRWGWLGFKLALVGAAALVLFGIYLDSKIRVKFDGQKWQLPALVYSRPLELYPGQRLSKAQMLHELKLLNYRASPHPSGAGQYGEAGNQLVVIRRGFHFYDGEEPARPLILTFSGQRLTKLQNADNRRELGYVRMDPVLLDRMSAEQVEDRLLLRLNEVPQLFIDTLLTVEDRDFYDHGGVSLLSIGRAFWANLRAGRTVQGGSTLTQQLAKNFFLTRERSLWRKVQEAYMAVIMDYRYSKDQILETYLNEIYLGQNGNDGVYGFGLASYFYFGLPLNELEPDQLALLVAMVRGPSYYDPWRFPERAQQRRDLVLRLLLENKQFNPQQYQDYVARPLGLSARGQMAYGRTPAFMNLLHRELKQRFGEGFIGQSGLKIFTSLDPVAQQAAEQAVSGELAKLAKSKSGLEGAMVVSNWHTGEVSAMVGGKDTRFAGFNRALDARRPIGSLIKPAVYYTGLMNGYRLATPLKDEPLSLKSDGGKTWRPQNYDKGYRGQVPLYLAMANSLNLPTVRLGMDVGLDKVVDSLKALGVTQSIPVYPSLLLGTLALSPYEVNQMYLTLANQGLYQPLTAIRAVVSEDGKLLYEKAEQAKRQLDPQASYLTLYTMTKVASLGTARSLAAQFPKAVLAGKTGTTDNLRDSWFSGLDNDEVVSVWVGRDDNQPAGLTGAGGALRLFSDYLQRRGVNSLQLNPPRGIITARFNGAGGHVADSCGNATSLPARSVDLPPAQGCSVLSAPIEQTKDWFESLFGKG